MSENFEHEMTMALIPTSYTVALPLAQMRTVKREHGYPNNSQLVWKFEYYNEWLCGFVLKSNAIIEYMAFEHNSILLQEWRMVPCAPSIGIFFPIKAIFIDSAADYIALQMFGIKKFGPTEESLDIELIGLFLPRDERVQRF